VKSKLWVKICGATSPQAVAAALDAGADAVGFVFAPSVRRVDPAQAAKLAAPARGRVRCVAVMQHPEQHEVDAVIAQFQPDVLQTDIDDFDVLKLPVTLERLPVLRAGLGWPQTLPARIVFEGPVSGAGVVTDWSRPAELRARGVALVLAGGLTPDNVDAAVRSVRPFGVDVSSGVESAPGVKCPQMIARFVAAARVASRES